MFDRICTALHLGAVTAPPLRLSGGFLHRMYRLDTTTGSWAVKLLNPEIMQRPDALENYRRAEGFEALLEARKLPILPARMIDGRKMHCVDGQYLYVYDYFDGRALQKGEITPAHCARIGEVLAHIHAVEQRPSEATAEDLPIDWDDLAVRLQASGLAPEESELLMDAVPMLEELTVAAMEAACRLPGVQALCHNDMDPKNVLWRGDEFRVIDLECLGYANPLQEMLDLAISWSEPEDERCFRAFVAAYQAAGGFRAADAARLFDSRRNYIDWLAYNAGRAMSGDAGEREIARTQLRETLGKLEADRNRRGQILRWMEEAV